MSTSSSPSGALGRSDTLPYKSSHAQPSPAKEVGGSHMSFSDAMAAINQMKEKQRNATSTPPRPSTTAETPSRNLSSAASLSSSSQQAQFSSIHQTHGGAINRGGNFSPSPAKTKDTIDSVLSKFKNDNRKVSGGRTASPSAPSAAATRGSSPMRRSGSLDFMKPTASQASRVKATNEIHHNGNHSRNNSPTRAYNNNTNTNDNTNGVQSPRRPQSNGRARSPPVWNSSGNAKDAPNKQIQTVKTALIKATSTREKELAAHQFVLAQQKQQQQQQAGGTTRATDTSGAPTTNAAARRPSIASASGGASAVSGGVGGDVSPMRRRPSLDPGRPLFTSSPSSSGPSRQRIDHARYVLGTQTKMSTSPAPSLGNTLNAETSFSSSFASPQNAINKSGTAHLHTSGLNYNGGGGSPRRESVAAIDFFEHSGYARSAIASADLFAHCSFATNSREGRIIALVKNFQQTSLFRWHTKVKQIRSKSNRCAFLDEADAKFLENVLARNIAFMRNLEAIIAEVIQQPASPSAMSSSFSSSPLDRTALFSTGGGGGGGDGIIDCGVVRYAHSAFEQSSQFNNAINLLLVGNTSQLNQLQKDKKHADAALATRHELLKNTSFSNSLSLPTSPTGAPSFLHPRQPTTSTTTTTMTTASPHLAHVAQRLVLSSRDLAEGMRAANKKKASTLLEAAEGLTVFDNDGAAGEGYEDDDDDDDDGEGSGWGQRSKSSDAIGSDDGDDAAAAAASRTTTNNGPTDTATAGVDGEEDDDDDDNNTNNTAAASKAANTATASSMGQNAVSNLVGTSLIGALANDDRDGSKSPYLEPVAFERFASIPSEVDVEAHEVSEEKGGGGGENGSGRRLSSAAQQKQEQQPSSPSRKSGMKAEGDASANTPTPPRRKSLQKNTNASFAGSFAGSMMLNETDLASSFVAIAANGGGSSASAAAVAAAAVAGGVAIPAHMIAPAVLPQPAPLSSSPSAAASPTHVGKGAARQIRSPQTVLWREGGAGALIGQSRVISKGESDAFLEHEELRQQHVTMAAGGGAGGVGVTRAADGGGIETMTRIVLDADGEADLKSRIFHNNYSSFSHQPTNTSSSNGDHITVNASSSSPATAPLMFNASTVSVGGLRSAVNTNAGIETVAARATLWQQGAASINDNSTMTDGKDNNSLNTTNNMNASFSKGGGANIARSLNDTITGGASEKVSSPTATTTTTLENSGGSPNEKDFTIKMASSALSDTTNPPETSALSSSMKGKTFTNDVYRPVSSIVAEGLAGHEEKNKTASPSSHPSSPPPLRQHTNRVLAPISHTAIASANAKDLGLEGILSTPQKNKKGGGGAGTDRASSVSGGGGGGGGGEDCSALSESNVVVYLGSHAVGAAAPPIIRCVDSVTGRHVVEGGVGESNFIGGDPNEPLTAKLLRSIEEKRQKELYRHLGAGGGGGDGAKEGTARLSPHREAKPKRRTQQQPSHALPPSPSPFTYATSVASSSAAYRRHSTPNSSTGVAPPSSSSPNAFHIPRSSSPQQQKVITSSPASSPSAAVVMRRVPHYQKPLQRSVSPRHASSSYNPDSFLANGGNTNGGPTPPRRNTSPHRGNARNTSPRVDSYGRPLSPSNALRGVGGAVVGAANGIGSPVPNPRTSSPAIVSASAAFAKPYMAHMTRSEMAGRALTGVPERTVVGGGGALQHTTAQPFVPTADLEAALRGGGGGGALLLQTIAMDQHQHPNAEGGSTKAQRGTTLLQPSSASPTLALVAGGGGGGGEGSVQYYHPSEKRGASRTSSAVSRGGPAVMGVGGRGYGFGLTPPSNRGTSPSQLRNANKRNASPHKQQTTSTTAAFTYNNRTTSPFRRFSTADTNASDGSVLVPTTQVILHNSVGGSVLRSPIHFDANSQLSNGQPNAIAATGGREGFVPSLSNPNLQYDLRDIYHTSTAHLDGGRGRGKDDEDDDQHRHEGWDYEKPAALAAPTAAVIDAPAQRSSQQTQHFNTDVPSQQKRLYATPLHAAASEFNVKARRLHLLEVIKVLEMKMRGEVKVSSASGGGGGDSASLTTAEIAKAHDAFKEIYGPEEGNNQFHTWISQVGKKKK